MVAFNVLGSSRNPMSAKFWLKSVSVDGEEIVNNGDVKEFLLSLEGTGAKVQNSDLCWINNLCRKVLGRDYAARTIEAADIQIGVGANVASDNLDIQIKKMASWPAEAPRRIYVDCIVNGEDFHYYINLTGKQGRYSKNSANSYNFSEFISKECDFLGVKSEKDVLSFRGTKGAYKREA